MSLCYLYSEPSIYPYRQVLLDAFEKKISLEIDSVQTLDEFGIYIIELHQADKDISQKLVNLFKKRKHSLIYFIIPKSHTLLLFQLIFLLESKSIITHNQNVEKIITKIKTDHETFLQNNLERWLGDIKIKTQDFFIYKNTDLIFVSNSLLDSFSSHDKSHFQTEILSQVNIDKLLKDNLSITLDIQNEATTQKKYTFTSVSASEGETVIYLKKAATQVLKHNLLSSRVDFIELLKDNLLQRNVDYKEIGLLTINIQNIKSLLTQYKVVEFEEILLEILMFMDSIIDNKLIFSQFKNHFYVVCFENISFEQLNIFTEHFHTKIQNHINTSNSKFSLDLFTFSLKNHELATILTTLNKIEDEDFQKNSTNDTYINHYSNLDREVNAKNLLDTAFEEKLTFKLLNIYHGLVVSTSSKVLKVTDENIYISFEPLQGVVLNLEKDTVIQSDSFSQDIYAKVKQISLSKKIAILENFKFLKTNANSRAYARVTTPIKIPVAINTPNNTVNGVMLDISIKSIAVQIKYAPKIALLEKTRASLIFNIQDKTAEDGYIQLNLPAEIIVVTNIDESGYYKVVCDLDQGSHDLDVVLKYIYDRQKELIIELKKMAKLN